uniref:Single stranded DNA binding protein 3b n=1 Tax=Sparus aurata TaxID=8175 RepID=A0A671USX5_SPAAU
MFPKGKGTPVPSDGQAREKLALYVYEYLLHIGAQKSAQTFLSEIRWEKNITLGEPPGFLHSWWCVFWDLYCAAPERRETCDHSSEAKAFHDYVSSAYTVAQVALSSSAKEDNNFFYQKIISCGPRGMGPMGPGPQNFGGGMRPPHNTMGPGMPGVNMGPGTGRPWPNPNNANSIILTCKLVTYSPQGASGGGGPPGTPIMPSPADSNNSGENLYTMINTGPGNRNNFPMGPGSDGPLGAMAGMEPHHMNGSLGSGDMDGMNKNSPNNLSGISNPPGTPRDDGELSGNFLHSFQSENYSPTMTMSV